MYGFVQEISLGININYSFVNARIIAEKLVTFFIKTDTKYIGGLISMIKISVIDLSTSTYRYMECRYYRRRDRQTSTAWAWPTHSCSAAPLCHPPPPHMCHVRFKCYSVGCKFTEKPVWILG